MKITYTNLQILIINKVSFLAILLFLLSFIKLSVSSEILVNQIIDFSMSNSALQKFAYVTFCLTLIFYSYFTIIKEKNVLNRYIEIYILIILINSFLNLNSTSHFLVYSFFISYYLIKLLPINLYCTIYVFFINNKYNIKILFTLLTFIIFIVYYLIPLDYKTPILNISNLYNYQMHYSSTVIPGILVGKDIDDFVFRLNYGISMPLISIYYYKIIALLNLHELSSIQMVVRFSQLIFLFLFAAIIFLISRPHRLTFIIGTILIQANLNVLGGTIDHPNSAGIRYLPFIFGIFIFTFFYKFKIKNIFTYSILSSFILFLNPELGVAFSVGVLYYCFSVNKIYIKSIRFLYFVSISIIIILSLQLLLSNLITNKIFISIYSDTFYFIKLFLFGYAQIAAPASLLCLLLIFISLYILIKNIINMKNYIYNDKEIFQASLCLMILTFLIYYFNRMSEANLWFCCVLIYILIVTMINNDLFISIYKNKSIPFSAVISICLTISIIFWSTERYYNETNIIKQINNSCYSDDRYLTAYCFKDVNLLNYLVNKLKILDNEDNKDQTLVISNLSAEVRLMGFNKNVPWYDFYGEINKDKDILNVEDFLNISKPLYIYIDNYSDIGNKIDINRSYQYSLLAKLFNKYSIQSSDEYWTIYKFNLKL